MTYRLNQPQLSPTISTVVHFASVRAVLLHSVHSVGFTDLETPSWEKTHNPLVGVQIPPGPPSNPQTSVSGAVRYSLARARAPASRRTPFAISNTQLTPSSRPRTAFLEPVSPAPSLPRRHLDHSKATWRNPVLALLPNPPHAPEVERPHRLQVPVKPRNQFRGHPCWFNAWRRQATDSAILKTGTTRLEQHPKLERIVGHREE